MPRRAAGQAHAGDGTVQELGKPISVERRVIQTVAEILNLPTTKVALDSPLSELGADEYDLLEIQLELEEEYDIRIEKRALRRLKTVADLVRYIQQTVEANRGKD